MLLNNGYSTLILDLDGTLIGRDERISPRVAEAVGKLKGRLKVSIATGREPADVLRFARQLGLTAPQVSDNGALVLDPADGREVWSAPLAPREAERVVTHLHGMKVAFIATHPGGTVTSFAQIDHWNITRVSGLDMEEALADELIASFATSRELHVVKVFLPYNGKWAVDFTRVGVNKATAARVLAQMFDTSLSSIIAAGDSYNDLPLLQVCGLRIVMGHAPDELKSIADYVAPTVDEDGLAVAIEEFVLPRLHGHEL
jgi:HAD superfamily hydrolase (TIGR01484 family)